MFPKNYLFPYIIIVASIIYPPKFMYFIQSTFIQTFTIYIIPALMQTEDNGHNISIVILMNYANRGEEKHARTTTQIPVGYIFKPSDHELIIDYLTRKIASYPLPSNVFVEIDAVDFFDKHPAKLVSCSSNETQWFFFIKQDDVNFHQKLTREVSNGCGFWQMEEPQVPICHPNGIQIGSKMMLRFFKKSSQPAPKRTHWRMIEFRLTTGFRIDNYYLS